LPAGRQGRSQPKMEDNLFTSPKDLGLLKKDWQNAFLHFSL
jgi:hypothetical protein